MNSGCRVCDTIAPGDLVDLDRLLGDPATWPATVWSVFNPPEGALPASYRRHGAMAMGMDWVKAHPEYSITKAQLRRHLRSDVPILDFDPDELVARGVIARSSNKTDRAVGQVIDSSNFIGFYNDGIRVGRTALQVLEQRINDLVERKEEVPLALVKMAMDAGLKLSMSQAAIVAAGKRMDSDTDEDDAFRSSGDPQQPSQRVGHHRVRKIDGERVVVVDMGPADRARYNDHAAETSGQKIGSDHG